jgi:hypothetical protein
MQNERSLKDYYRKRNTQLADVQAREQERQNIQEQQSCKFRFYTRTYQGVHALVASCIKKACDPFATDYGKSLVDEAIRIISEEGVQPSASLSVEKIVSGENDFKTAAINAYKKALINLKDQETQIGGKANFVTYK